VETRGYFHVNMSLLDVNQNVVKMCSRVLDLFYLQEREDVVILIHALMSNNQHTEK
jgi:hypothetical protein